MVVPECQAGSQVTGNETELEHVRIVYPQLSDIVGWVSVRKGEI